MPLEGEYNMECNDIPFNLREGDIIIICPGVLHHLYASHGRRIIFQVDLSMIQSFDEYDSFFAIMQPAIVVTPEQFPEIHGTCVKLMKEIYDEYFGNAPLKNISIVQRFLSILVMVGRNYTASPERFAGIRPTKQQEYTEKFLSICNYLNQHCTEDLTLESVAAHAGFSKYYFERIFSEYTGMTLYQYLQQKQFLHQAHL